MHVRISSEIFLLHGNINIFGKKRDAYGFSQAPKIGCKNLQYSPLIFVLFVGVLQELASVGVVGTDWARGTLL